MAAAPVGGHPEASSGPGPDLGFELSADEF